MGVARLIAMMESSEGEVGPQLRAALDREHARQLELLGDVRFLVARGNARSAARVLAGVRMTLEQHLRREEALIDRLAQEEAVPPSIAEATRREHAALRALVERTWEAVSRQDRRAFDREVRLLEQAIGAHERGEKDCLLPLLGNAIADPAELMREVLHLVERQELEP